MSKLTRTQIYIQSDVLEKLKVKASLMHKNLSQYIREVLEKDLQNQAKTQKPKISVVKVESRKIENYSERVNQIYDHKL